VTAYVVVISYYNITAIDDVRYATDNHTKNIPYYNYNHTIIYQPQIIIQRETRDRDSWILDRCSRTQLHRGLTTWA